MSDAFLIAIEGSDGTGKETQSRLLKEWFLLKEKTVTSISFPRYKETAGGWALWEALKGVNKDAYAFSEVDPLAASLLYAADRRESLPFLKKQIATHDVVIFDRYVQSNLLHQGGKFVSDEDKNVFADMVHTLEHKLLKLPYPNVTLYLDLPVENAISRAEKRAAQKGETPDAVEVDHAYIRNSHEAGRFYAKKFDWLVIPCVRDDGYEYSREEVNSLVIGKLRTRLDLSF